MEGGVWPPPPPVQGTPKKPSLNRVKYGMAVWVTPNGETIWSMYSVIKTRKLNRNKNVSSLKLKILKNLTNKLIFIFHLFKSVKHFVIKYNNHVTECNKYMQTSLHVLFLCNLYSLIVARYHVTDPGQFGGWGELWCQHVGTSRRGGTTENMWRWTDTC